MPALVVAFLLTNTLKQNALFLLLSRALSPTGDSLGDFYHLVSSAENVIKKSFAIIFFFFFFLSEAPCHILGPSPQLETSAQKLFTETKLIHLLCAVVR